jgi:hypothetical protein
MLVTTSNILDTSCFDVFTQETFLSKCKSGDSIPSKQLTFVCFKKRKGIYKTLTQDDLNSFVFSPCYLKLSLVEKFVSQLLEYQSTINE